MDQMPLCRIINRIYRWTDGGVAQPMAKAITDNKNNI